MYKCPHCGGEIAFLPESGIIKCEFCGSEFSPESEELRGTRKKAEEHTVEQEQTDSGKENPGKVYICSQCGASLYTLEDTGVTFCSYCGSQAFLESRIRGTEDIMPEVVIPFRVSKEECEKIYKQKIKSAWFLPRAMRGESTIDKFRGIYMPCWIYSGEAKADGDYITTTTTRDGRYDIINTYHVTVDARGTYGGFVEDAAASFPDGIMREIAPFDMRQSKKFNDTYLAGYYADIGNVPEDVYEDKIIRSLDASVKNDLADDKELKKHNVTMDMLQKKTDVKTEITNVRKGFFPVWFLSNRNVRTGLMSYAVINGLTGKIHADLPVDMKKYLLLSLLIAIPVFLLLQFFTMKPVTLLVITMILLGILMFFATKMIGDAYIQEHGLDDEGLLYMEQKKRGKAGSADAKSRNHVKKTSSPGRNWGKVIAGIACGVGLPLLSIAIYMTTGKNMIGWGFIAGIFLMVFLVADSSRKKTSAGKKDFTPGGKVKLPVSVVLRSILFPLIGIVAGVIMLVAHPVHDAWYYGAVLLCCVMLILTLLDFVRSNNRLSLRKPAQLGRRGGDEND